MCILKSQDYSAWQGSLKACSPNSCFRQGHQGDRIRLLRALFSWGLQSSKDRQCSCLDSSQHLAFLVGEIWSSLGTPYVHWLLSAKQSPPEGAWPLMLITLWGGNAALRSLQACPFCRLTCFSKTQNRLTSQPTMSRAILRENQGTSLDFFLEAIGGVFFILFLLIEIHNL